MNIISSNERTSSTGMYEQLKPAMLSRSRAGPAVIKALMEGITSFATTASYTAV